MAKVIMVAVLLLSTLISEEIPDKETSLFQNCISCHIQEQTPSELIYRRYLMKYGSQERMKTAIFSYLQNPDQNNSIMPKQFFMKSSSKERTDMNETELNDSIEAYLEFYDIKRRLELPTP